MSETILFRCVRCSRSKPAGQFSSAKHKRSGVKSWCKDCDREYLRHFKRNRTAEYRRGVLARRGSVAEREHARRAISRAIRSGRMQSAKACECCDCGRPAAQYDHHEGYSVEKRLTVQPVCFECHGLRSRARGEHRRKS